jgi:hypothetical protein
VLFSDFRAAHCLLLRCSYRGLRRVVKCMCVCGCNCCVFEVFVEAVLASVGVVGFDLFVPVSPGLS